LQVQEVIRAAVRRDVVVIAPILPSAPPRIDAAPATAAAFLRRARHFAALTALTGTPTVVLPLGPCAAADGAPVAVAIFGQARSDQRLLAVACKLLPLAQAELEKQQQPPEVEATIGSGTPRGGGGKAKLVPGAAGAGRGRRAPGAPAPGATAAGRPATKRTAGSGAAVPNAAAAVAAAAAATAAGAPPPDPKKLERAEKAKARGNELFRKGEYLEAVKAYTEALRHAPDSPVYYSNRAMAYLKAFRWGGSAGGRAVRGGRWLGRPGGAWGGRGFQRHAAPLPANQPGGTPAAHMQPSPICFICTMDSRLPLPYRTAAAPRFEQAEADCNRALGFDLSSADRVKALLRRGTARQHLYRVAEAAEDFRAALKLEPNNRQAREELRVSGRLWGRGAWACACEDGSNAPCSCMGPHGAEL
jgi:tetratricopeptide (TPR) repeat protein